MSNLLGTIGQVAGGVAGTCFGGPIGGAVGATAGKAVGDAVGGSDNQQASNNNPVSQMLQSLLNGSAEQ